MSRAGHQEAHIARHPYPEGWWQVQGPPESAMMVMDVAVVEGLAQITAIPVQKYSS